MARRTGFTLIETLITIVIVGLLVLIAYPKVSSALMTNNMRSARTALVNMVAKARAASLQSSRITWLKFEGDRAVILARPRRVLAAGSDADTIGAVLNFAEYGMGVSGADSIRFNPGGLGSGLGGGVTLQVYHGSYNESIQIDGMGRVTK